MARGQHASREEERTEGHHRLAASGAAVMAVKLHHLEDLLADPSLLEPPPVVVPRLAWAGRLSLLAAPEKHGKSTLVGQAIAAKAAGADFLGEATTPGTTLWLGLDEPLNDI